MSVEEQKFLVRMNAIALRQAEFEKRLYIYPEKYGAICRSIEVDLRAAGRELLLLPRFNVRVDTNAPKPKLVITPLNGQADRMLARYEQLYLEYELSKG